MKKTLLSFTLVITLLLTSCSTLVRIDTPNAPGATVKVDGKVWGNTPVEKELSDAIWETYPVEVTKEGYKPYQGELEKELKVGTFIGGFIIWPFWLWTYGPESYQEIDLEPLEEDK
ncbi:MAG: PEGA domain-containing protein [Candidatus Marinimicrobia bacterium]|nr:PEGA domain-containing protein [Candidatus Neomarinimicrobiota bacterium]